MVLLWGVSSWEPPDGPFLMEWEDQLKMFPVCFHCNVKTLSLNAV